MVPSVMKGINFGYNQSLQDLAVKFFSQLAMEDLSVLCFGGSVDDIPKKILGEEAGVTLPSWMGNDGENFVRASDAYISTSFSDYSITDGTMRAVTQCFSVAVESDSHMSYKEAVTLDFCDMELDVEVELPVRVSMSDPSQMLTFIPFFQRLFSFIGPFPGEFELAMTHMLPLVQSGKNWVNEPSSLISQPVGGSLSLIDQNSGEVVILYGIKFNFPGEPDWGIHPVVKQDNDHYKTIGICVLFNHLVLPDAVVIETRDLYIK